ncbi:hypothetical protein Tco_1506914 [Tanacetum coccineum]
MVDNMQCPVWECYRLVSRAKVIENQVMAISVISISSDSLEDSVGTPVGRVILFGTIPTTIPDTIPFVIPPTTHIDTTPIPTISPTIPSSPDYTPASDTEFDPSEDPSSDHIPPLPITSPFLSSTDDSSDSDIPDTPPSPTHGTPFTKTTLSTQRSPTASDRFSSDDSLRDSSSSSSSESSSDSSADALSDSASSRSSFDMLYLILHLVVLLLMHYPHHHWRPSHGSSSASLSRKRSRSPIASVPLSSPTLGALSYARADLLPSPKRIKSPETTTDLEGCSEDSFKPYVPKEAGLGVDFKDESSESLSRGTDLEMDVDVERSDGIEINPEVQADIDECFAYVDALRDRGIDARVVVEAIDREDIKTGVRGPVEDRVDRVTHPVVADDIPEPAQDGSVEVIESVQRDQGYRIVATRQQSAHKLERIGELELRVQRELRQIRRFKFYDRMRIARLEACARRHLSYCS